MWVDPNSRWYDSAKNGSARVAGVEAPKHEDKETTITELKTRITETVAFLKTIDETAFNAGADKQIVFPLGKLYKGEMKGDAYVTHFMLANYYFHLTTAYAILRHSGVDIGKMSFLGTIPLTRTAGTPGVVPSGRPTVDDFDMNSARARLSALKS